MPDLRIGTSGWRYRNWRGVFYPKGLQQRRELEYLASKLNSVEINGSFYALQRPESFARWRNATPPEFVFALKGSRFITHMKKLRDPETPLANFFASGVLALEDKLGPIVWQLPPNLGFDEARLDAFFRLLPRDTVRAASLAERHDQRLDGRSFLEVAARRPIRHAVEARHASYADPRFFDLLAAHGIALCIADTAGRFPFLDAVTADLVYVRLHGAEELYASGYTPAQLDAWADRARGWLRDGRDVHVYFDNDARVHAPFDAIGLARRLEVW